MITSRNGRYGKREKNSNKIIFIDISVVCFFYSIWNERKFLLIKTFLLNLKMIIMWSASLSNESNNTKKKQNEFNVHSFGNLFLFLGEIFSPSKQRIVGIPIIHLRQKKERWHSTKHNTNRVIIMETEKR